MKGGASFVVFLAPRVTATSLRLLLVLGIVAGVLILILLLVLRFTTGLAMCAARPACHLPTYHAKRAPIPGKSDGKAIVSREESGVVGDAGATGR